jgi:tetratricopeptide (TPR) repeat protein
MDAFNKAISLNPDYAEAYYNLGVAQESLGHWQEAIDAYRKAIGTTSDSADARNNLANRLALEGRCDEAVDQYRAALRLKPDWTDPINNLALLIATHPEIRNRDTNEAIRLASRACELSGYKDPVILGTLAAAYASAGRFDEAIATADRAMNLADAANQPRVKDTIAYHLSLYKQGKPYIEPSSGSQPGGSRP